VRSPLLGEHTEEVLRDVLGFDQRAISEIRESGALGTVRPKIAAE
jgi:formyl-CoA transferase